jgi:hypothetical protein
MKFQETVVVAKASGYIDQLAKEAIEIRQELTMHALMMHIHSAWKRYLKHQFLTQQ